MSKQDRQPARTAGDIERKYNFGKSFAEVMGIAEDARSVANEAKESASKPSEKLTHEEVFNLLTKNGALQGLYRGKDGELYVNATYIQSGQIAGERVDASTLDIADGAKIAGWSVDDNSIRTGTLGGDGSMWLCRNGTTTKANIGTGSGNGWSIGVGGSFGVKKDGAMYAKNANISGTVTADSGTIGGWQIAEDELYGISEDGVSMHLYPTGKYFYVSESSSERFYIVMYNRDNVPTGGIGDSGWKTILSEKYYTPISE
jgi:hypothetical protein